MAKLCSAKTSATIVGPSKAPLKALSNVAMPPAIAIPVMNGEVPACPGGGGGGGGGGGEWSERHQSSEMQRRWPMWLARMDACIHDIPPAPLFSCNLCPALHRRRPIQWRRQQGPTSLTMASSADPAKTNVATKNMTRNHAPLHRSSKIAGRTTTIGGISGKHAKIMAPSVGKYTKCTSTIRSSSHVNNP